MSTLRRYNVSFILGGVGRAVGGGGQWFTRSRGSGVLARRPEATEGYAAT